MSVRSKGSFSGPPEESIFSYPMMLWPPRDDWKPLFEKIASLNDGRLLAVVGAMVVENRVDHILELFCRRYTVLKENRDFSFSMKIRVLEAIELIPHLITDAADMVRLIRNEFAHNLNVEQFIALKESLRTRFKKFCKRAFTPWDDPGTDDTRWQTHFKFVVTVACSGIDAYVPNAEALRDALSQDAFVHGFLQSWKDKHPQDE